MSETEIIQESWHQRKAARDRWETRHEKAHYQASDFLSTGKALCGAKNFRVYIDPYKDLEEVAKHESNNVCKKCLAYYVEHGVKPESLGPPPGALYH